MTRPKTRRRFFGRNDYQALEPRQLLAGDVTVVLDGGQLGVFGDGLSNQVQVNVNAAGDLIFTGLEDTTINGGTGQLVFTEDFDVLAIALLDGDDEIRINGVTVPDNLVFFGGAGNDRFVLENSVANHLHLDGEAGDDVFEFNNAFSSESAYLFLSEGDDTVAVTSFSAGRNLRVFGGAGDDTFAAATLAASRDLSFEFGAGNDDLLLAGATAVGDDASADLGEGDDFFAVTPAVNATSPFFSENLDVSGGGGDDTFVFDPNAGGAFNLDGGPGTDSLEQPPAAPIGSISNFESGVPDQAALLDQVFANLTDDDIAVEPFGGVSIAPISLTVDPEPLMAVGTFAPISIDSTLTIDGPASQIVSGATVSIIGFDPDEDILSFSDTTDITGVFDDTAGVLTLTGDATVAEYQDALRNVLFQNTGSGPEIVPRTLEIEVTSFDQTAVANREVSVVFLSLIMIPNVEASFGEPLSIQLEIDPVDGATQGFEVSAEGLPPGSNEPSVTPEGVIEFTPSAAGTFELTAAALGEADVAIEESFTVTVSDFVPFEGTGALSGIPAEQRNDIFTEAPPLSIDFEDSFEAVFETEVGQLTFELFDDLTPVAVNNFVNLARDGFFDGLTFHRVIEGFVAQGGDPLGNGTGGPGFVFDNEVDNGLSFDRRGLLAFANAGTDINGNGTNGSQFFITFDATPALTGGFSIFGEITAGEDVLDQIARTFIATGGAEIPTGLAPTVINSIDIIQTPSS